MLLRNLLPGLALLLLIPAAGAAELKKDEPKLLPDVVWEDADGNTHRLSDSNGKPRILHFWAAWCVPCRKEMPEMLSWKQANPDIPVIALSMDKRMAQSKYFIKKYKLDMAPLLLKQKDDEELKVPMLPYSIFLTADGKQIAHQAGIAPWESDEYTQQVRALYEGGQ